MRAIIILFVLSLAGCARSEKAMTTGQFLARAEVVGILPGFTGDNAYAQVRSEALPSFYANFRSVLSEQGLVKWDDRFDCNRFAGLYITLAHARYAVAAWHSYSEAQALALAEVWYVQESGGAHAIVAAHTERGLVFIEPQTGKEIHLSERERASFLVVKW
jgi:hypothetical protein